MSQNATPPREPTQPMIDAARRDTTVGRGFLVKTWKAMYDAWQPLEPPAPPPVANRDRAKSCRVACQRLPNGCVYPQCECPVAEVAAEPSSVDALLSVQKAQPGLYGAWGEQVVKTLRSQQEEIAEQGRIIAGSVAKSRLIEAEAAVAPDARDAQRYRWLRDKRIGFPIRYAVSGYLEGRSLYEVELDAAIDAAIAEQGKQ